MTELRPEEWQAGSLPYVHAAESPFLEFLERVAQSRSFPDKASDASAKTYAVATAN
jgi:hypothetical protein